MRTFYEVESVTLGILNETTFNRLLRRSTFTLLLALGVPGLILLALVIFMRGSANWVDHTDEVLTAANNADKLMFAMQTGFRGYRMTGDEEMLEPYRLSRTTMGARLDQLTALVTDNPAQTALVHQFRADLNSWLAFIDSQFDAVRSGRIPVTNTAFLTEGGPMFSLAESRLEKFIRAEEELRAARMRRLNGVTAAVVGMFSVGAFFGIPFLLYWQQNLLRKTSHSYRASLTEATRRAGELRVTLASIGDAVVATDAEGQVEFLNPAAEKLTGWKSSEAAGRPLSEVFEIFNEHTHAKVENPVDRVLRENVVVGLANHTVLRARDGRELPIEDSAAPIRGLDGEVRGVILVFHDVTAKRGEERLLAQSETRLRFLNELNEATRMLAEPAEIMAATVRALGRHLGVSRCAYGEVAADGEHFTVLHDYTHGCASIVGDYRLSTFGERAAVLRTGEPLVLRNVTAEVPAGSVADAFHALGIESVVCLAFVKNGELRALMAVHQATPRDWTPAELSLIHEVVDRCWETIERARAELALHAAKNEAEAAAARVADAAERFRLLAEVVSLQVWTATAEGRIDFANHEFGDYLGVPIESGVLGEGWTQFIHPDDLARTLAAWQKSVTEGTDYETELRLRDKDGAHRWFLSRAAAMRTPDGRILKWFGTNTNIDELKRAQAEAERANHAKDDFIAALSHELRTPLTPVLLTASTLREDDRLPPDVKEQLSMMERNISLEARLIDDLLDLTSISRGKLSFRTQPCDAHALIGFACDIVQDDARSKGITLSRIFNARHSGLLADPARFQQVLWNLLRNAVKFTPPGGTISVKTTDERDEAEAPWLRIEVADTGVGLTPPELEQIFRPFEQGRLKGSHHFGGIGLGLTIARAIVNLHGGSIHAESAGTDRGATFVVQLPRMVSTAGGQATLLLPAALPPTKTEPSPEPVTPPRLLLVEDHESTLQTMTRLLTRAGYQVTPTNTVASALEAAAAGSFDLVVSDLGLPDGTGLELMEQLRARHQLRGIALSGYGMDEDITRSREAGFFAHLTKPVDFSQLKRVLKAVTES